MAILLPLAAAPADAAAPKRRAAAPAPRRTPAPPPHQIAPAGTLTEADLLAIAMLKAKAPNDKFADDPTVRYIGRDFVLMFKDRTDLDIDYDRTAQRLKVSINPRTETIILKKDTTSGRYTGQNGYGAKTTVSTLKGNFYGVWLPGNSVQGHGIEYQANLDGSSARSLSENLQLRLSGTVAKAEGSRAASDNSAIYTKPIFGTATVTEPLDVWIDGYYVAAAFTKAEWIDGRTGQVLRTDDIATESTR